MTEVAGKKIEGPRELQLIVGGMNPGAKVEVKVLRDGQDKTFNVELAEMPTRELAANRAPAPKPDAEPDVLDGVTVADIDAQMRRDFNLPEELKGAVVTKVEPDSPSAEAGIKVGDVIQEVSRTPVTNAKEAVEMSEKVKKEKKVLLLVSTKGASRFVFVERKD